MADEIKSLVVRYDGTINEFKDNVLNGDGSIKDAEFRNKVVFIYGSSDNVTTDNLIQSIWVSDNDNGKFFDLTNMGNISGALNYINGLRTYGIPINGEFPQTYEADLQGGQGLLLKGINGINVRFNPSNTEHNSDANGKEYWTIEIGLGNDIYNAETGKINESLLPDYILGQLMFGGTIENRQLLSTEPTEPEIYIKPTKSFIDKFGFNPNTVDIQVFPYTFDAANYEGVYFIVKHPTAEGSGSTINMPYPVVWQGVTYDVGDWFLSNGVEWVKIDNTDAVTEVAGLRGNITTENLITKLTDEELTDRLVSLKEISAMFSVKVITPSN